MNRLAVFAVVTLIVASCSDSTGNASISGLRFIQQPANVSAGQPFTVSVELLDANGARVSASNSVSLTATTGTVTGTSTVRAVAGVATFTDIAVTQVAANVQLGASSGSVTATSSSFSVIAGPAATGQSTISPATGPLVAFAENALLFTFRDQFNNPIVSAPVTVTTSLAGSTLTPGSGVTSPTGTFSTVFRPSTTGSATFAATVDGTPVALANSFAVQDVCAAALFSFPGTVTGSIPNGACVLNGFPSAAHRFNVINEFVARFSVTAPFTPLFGVSSIPAVEGFVLRASPGLSATDWLLPAGVYNAWVGSFTGAGAYSVTGIIGNSDVGCTLRRLAVPGTYTTQRLQENDCNTDDFGVFEPPDGSRADFFVIQSARPCTITMRSSVMNSFLVVRDGATGEPIAANDNAGGGQDALISLPACRSGANPLEIIANQFVPDLGPYTLIITFGAPGTGTSLTSPVTSKRLSR